VVTLGLPTVSPRCRRRRYAIEERQLAGREPAERRAPRAEYSGPGHDAELQMRRLLDVAVVVARQLLQRLA